jgi:hypothetical protein
VIIVRGSAVGAIDTALAAPEVLITIINPTREVSKAGDFLVMRITLTSFFIDFVDFIVKKILLLS